MQTPRQPDDFRLIQASFNRQELRRAKSACQADRNDRDDVLLVGNCANDGVHGYFRSSSMAALTPPTQRAAIPKSTFRQPFQATA
jgi:hypothetical protein